MLSIPFIDDNICKTDALCILISKRMYYKIMLKKIV